jgi:hypothetical protein
MFTIVVLKWCLANYFFFFFFKKLEVFITDTCGKAHLPSKNQEITELYRPLFVCTVEWWFSVTAIAVKQVLLIREVSKGNCS